MLEVVAVSKRFAPDKPVLQEISLTVATAATLCLLGPSGCGKSTLLRIIAGLEQPDQGRVRLRGSDITEQPPHRRGIGLMFQDYALFPHLDVAANIGYGLRMQGMPAEQRRARIQEMLALVDLERYARRSVDALSGGEQQRVALARTLAPNPALLLLDEPVANLDRLLREELVQALRQILRHLQVTTIFVTHDQEEAYALADQIAVMHAGRIEQVATPQYLYRRPANAFVAGFLGFQNLLPATCDATTPPRVSTCAGAFALPAAGAISGAGWRLLIPPDAAVLDDQPPAPSYLPLPARVVASHFRGSVFRLQVTPLAAAPTCVLHFEFRNRGRDHVAQPGDVVALWVDTAQMSLIRE